MIPRHFLPKNYRRSITFLAAGILIAAVTLYLALPIVALFLRITPDLFFATLHDPDVASALWLSLFTTGYHPFHGHPCRDAFCLFPFKVLVPGKSSRRYAHRSPAGPSPGSSGCRPSRSLRQGRAPRQVLQHARDHRLHLPRLR